MRALAASAGSLAEVTARESVCRACDRLVQWREHVALTRRRSFQHETYWGRPVAGWGDDQASILILGLAPAAHGGNRTGRIFTGDRSGDVLFASLWRCGLADSARVCGGWRRPAADQGADGGCRPLRAACQQAGAAERDAARPGSPPSSGCSATASGWSYVSGISPGRRCGRSCRSADTQLPRPRPAFGHGAEVSRRRWAAGSPACRARLLPPEPAEHLHRPGHRCHARRRLQPGTRTFR